MTSIQKLFACIVALLLSTTLAAAELAPSKQQSITAKSIIATLDRSHYASQAFGDGLSSRFLDNYINRLDGNRSFFLASDIESFDKYRYELDDELGEGSLTAGFAIFNRYQQRANQRMEKIIAGLPEMVSAFDFSKQESLVLDRSELPWAKDQQELDEIWRKRLKSRVLTLRLTGKTDEEIVTNLQKRFRNQLHRINQTNAEDAFQLYINSLTQLYDPHTSYFSPSNSENFDINMSRSLEGIGAVLQSEDEFTKVVRIIHAGPADKQGELRPSDRIVAVGQGDDGEMEDVIGMRLDEVVQLIRGAKGTAVRLEVLPANATADIAEAKIIKITRDKVKLEEQSAKKAVIEVMQDDRLVKIGVIDIPAFYIDFNAWQRGDPNFKSTTRDVSRLLNQLLNEGVEGIVIDLRENGGGSLQEAKALTGLFIDIGPTVQIKDSGNRVQRLAKIHRTPFYDGPLVVMINRLSASASEIFAAAIQDYQRGIVVGSQSFGKGTVQSLTDLPQGKLKLTESKYYRISGESTQHRGVIPDIAFPQLFDADEVGESSLEYALSWDRIKPARYRQYFNIPALLPALQQQHNERSQHDPDFIFLQEQLQQVEKNREITEVSLNIDARKQWDKEQEQLALAMENRRRVAKGLEPLAALDDKQDEEDSAADEADQGVNRIDTSDPLLNEAVNILVDALPVFTQAQYALGNKPVHQEKNSLFSDWLAPVDN